MLLLVLFFGASKVTAQGIELGMSKVKVLALMEQHPEWKGHDGSIVEAARKLSKEFAAKNPAKNELSFDSLPMGGEKGTALVSFDKSDVAEKVIWEAKFSFENRKPLTHYSSLFDRIRDSLIAAYQSEGERVSNEDGTSHIWKIGPAIVVLNYDPNLMSVLYSARYDKRKKK
jgi:hypothetical protein